MPTKRGEIAEVAAGAFKARCLRIMDEVARTGRRVTVTKRGRPLVTIAPAEAEAMDLETWHARGRRAIELPEDDEALLRPLRACAETTRSIRGRGRRRRRGRNGAARAPTTPTATPTPTPIR